MKTKFTALALFTVAALSLAPKPAVANDKGLAIVGGFLGGLIVANAINDSRYDNAYDRSDTTVVVSDRADRCEDRYNRYDDRYEDRRESGFWKDVSVQVWVPGVWIVERSRHGRCYDRFVSGHYESRTNRVWVSHDRHDRDGHHEDREVSRGYGHNRR